jgi:hypothetical protein
MADLINDLLQKIIENRKQKKTLPLDDSAPEQNNNITENVVQGIVQNTSEGTIPIQPSPLEESMDKPPTPIIAEIIQNIISQIQNPSKHLEEDSKPNYLISNIIQSIISQISTPPEMPIIPELSSVVRPEYPPVSNIEASIIEGLITPHTNKPFRTNQLFTIKKPNIEVKKKENDTDNTVASVIEGIIQSEPEIDIPANENEMGNIVPSAIENIIQSNPEIEDNKNKDDKPPTNVLNKPDEKNADSKPSTNVPVNTNGNTVDDYFMNIEKTFKKLQEQSLSENA